MDKRQRDRRSATQQGVFIQRPTTQIDPRALAAHHQLENQRRSRQNRNPRGTRFTNERVAGGSSAETYTRFHPTEGVKGVRTHDVTFDRTANQQKGGTPFAPPTRGGAGRRVQGAQMSGIVGQTLDAIPIGDRVTGQFSDQGMSPETRANWFSRETNGAIGGENKARFDIKRVARDKWLREDGKVITWDPGQNKRNLAGMAIRRGASIVGGPVMQGVMQLDGLLEQTFGKGLFQHQSENAAKTGRKLKDWGLL